VSTDFRIKGEILPRPSLHRSQILKDLRTMQAVAAERSGYAGNHLRSSSYGVSANRERSRHSEATAEFRCFLERRVKIVRFDSLILKQALEQTRSVCSRAF